MDPGGGGALRAHNIFRVLQVLTLIPAWALMAAVISWSLPPLPPHFPGHG